MLSLGIAGLTAEATAQPAEPATPPPATPSPAPGPVAPTEPATATQPAPAAEAGTDAAAPAAEPPAATPPTAAAPVDEPVSSPPPDSAPEGGDDAVGSNAPIADAGAWAAAWGDAATTEEDTPVFEGRLYGFVDAYVEQVAKTPARDPNDPSRTIYESNPYEFDVLNLNAMVQGSIYGRYRFFLNLAAPGAGSATDDEGIGVRNAWVEAPIVPGYLNVRAGKTYRRFGLYNEILDAVPTFIGIEPPELFDKDHLMLTRTTNLMLHGVANFGSVALNYAITTGNEERTNDAVPIGIDLYAEIDAWLRLGTSFYTTGGDAAPSRGVGDGSPRGGVLNWMETDRFMVFGGYAQIQHDSGLIVQLEGWQADHDAKRDPDALQALADDGSLTDIQMERFFTNGDVDMPRTSVEYAIRTAYLRVGYEIPTGDMPSITPYAQADYYDNPETVASKDLGGDNEAGIADDGIFQKYTLGAVIRPVPQVALKLDGSAHVQKFNDATEFYPEVRVSFSYLWGLQ